MVALPVLVADTFRDHFSESFDFAIVTAIIMASLYLLGPSIRSTLRSRPAVAASFGGGAAVAYVFLQLIPEIEVGHELLGDRIYFMILASFIAFFAIELHLHTRARRQAAAIESGQHDAGATVFWLHIAFMWVYTWLIVFTLPDELSESFAFALLGSVALGLHSIYKDFVLRSNHHSSFEVKGQYVLVLAPLAGWLARVFATPSEMFFDLVMAILAGFLIQSVFREEIPGYHRIRLPWFVGGTGVYSILVFLIP